MTDSTPPRPPGARWPARLLAAATIGYTAVLLWATHHPQPQQLLGPSPPHDKSLHLGAYALLGGLVAATLAAAGRLSLRGAIAAALALATFGAFDEITQPLPWFRRSADPFDWVSDVVGSVGGIAAVAAVVAAARRLLAR